jgi:uncharacterized protein YndB with AHSA1/START domain
MPDIRHSIQIDTPADRVFALVSTAAGLAKWWAADVTEDASAKTVELGFFKRSTVYRLKPISMAAPREADWLCESGKEWANTKINFKLTENAGKTTLQFAHNGWQADTDYFISCNTVWGELMFRIKAAAEGKTPGPLFSATGLDY